MVKFSATVAVPSTPEALWEYLGDFRQQPAFSPHTKAAYLETPEPLGQGARFRQVASFMGRSFETQVELVEFVPGRKVAYEVKDGPFPLRWSYELEATSSGTEVHIETTASPAGFFRLAEPLLTRKVRSDSMEDIRRLSEMVQGNSARARST